MGTVEPSGDRLESFLQAGEASAPIVMINLLRYRAVADYPEDFDAEPCSGREAYQRYGAVAGPLIQGVGGRMLWAGQVSALVIGPEDEAWDDAILVEYPSREAFLTMVSKPEYQAVAPHRTAALVDSRLVATTAVASVLD